MQTFAFLVPPTNLRQLKNFWPITKILPFKILKIKRIRSSPGKEIQGYLVALPFFSLDKIIAAGKIAKKLGAKIIGVRDDASIIADQGYTMAKNLEIPLTTGSTLLSWSIFEAIYRISKTKNIDLKKTTLTVIGAGDAVGSLCARKLSGYVQKIILIHSHKDKLELLRETLLQLNALEVAIEEDIQKAVSAADIVVITPASSNAIFNPERLKPGAIICDASLPSIIAEKATLRQDITLIKAGLVRLPYPDDLNLELGLPKDIICACLAETMLLALDERFVDYSLGENINLDKMEEIADLATQYGFEIWVPEAPVR